MHFTNRIRPWIFGASFGLSFAACTYPNPSYDPGGTEAAGTSSGETTDGGDGVDVDGSDDGPGDDSSGGSGEPTAVCGDGVRQLGELCDDGQVSGLSCRDFGYGGGTLACDLTSCDSFELSSCEVCGESEDDTCLGLLACDGDAACSFDDDAECCTAEQCLDTCMVPCDEVDDCPFSGMGCHHGYCLFPCQSDEDCAPWPGYTCQHGMKFCESD